MTIKYMLLARRIPAVCTSSGSSPCARTARTGGRATEGPTFSAGAPMVSDASTAMPAPLTAGVLGSAGAAEADLAAAVRAGAAAAACEAAGDVESRAGAWAGVAAFGFCAGVTAGAFAAGVVGFCARGAEAPYVER